MKMSLKEKTKSKAKNKVKKIVFKVLKPFLPFIIIIVGLFFAICSLIDAIFIQEVQTKDTDLPEIQLELKNKCIQKAEYLNTCHNFKDGESTNYLLSVDNRENDKLLQWSHLYSLMAFHNMSNGEKMNENLLNEIGKEFESTFKYEKTTIKMEVTTKDEEGKENKETKEQETYILVESDTIIGHYKYNYEDKTTTKDNSITTGKTFVSEELIGEKYERLKKYLKNKLHIRKDELDSDVEIVIQAANRLL